MTINITRRAIIRAWLASIVLAFIIGAYVAHSPCTLAHVLPVPALEAL